MTENMDIFKFKVFLKQKKYSFNTIENYVYDLQKLAQYVSNGRIAQLSAEELRSFLDYEHQRGLSDASKLRTISLLRLFYTFNKRDDLISMIESYSIDYSSNKSIHKEVLSTEDIQIILSYLNIDENKGLRNYLIIAFMYYYALKIEVVLSLTISDLHNSSLMNILTAHRILTLPIPCQALLKKYTKGRDNSEFLFKSQKGGKLNRKTVWKIIKNIGIEMDMDLNTEIFRQSKLAELQLSLTPSFFKQVLLIRKRGA